MSARLARVVRLKITRTFMVTRYGGVAEWLKAHAWKACLRETVTWVRIPLPPPSGQASSAGFSVRIVRPADNLVSFVSISNRAGSLSARAGAGSKFDKGQGNTTFLHLTIAPSRP